MKHYLRYIALCLVIGVIMLGSGCTNSSYTGSGSKENIVSDISDFRTLSDKAFVRLDREKEVIFVDDAVINKAINRYIGVYSEYYCILSDSDLTYCPNETGYTAIVGAVSGTAGTFPVAVAYVPSWYLDKPVTAVTSYLDSATVMILDGDMIYVTNSDDSRVLLCYKDKCVYGYAAHDYALKGKNGLGGGATAFGLADDGMLISDDKLVAVNLDWVKRSNDHHVLTVPDDVTIICTDAFKYGACSSPIDFLEMYYITCPDNVKIETGAFSEFSGVNVSIKLGKNADIAPYAFAQSEFDTLYIDDTVNKIPFEAFEDCYGTVELSDSVQLIGNPDNVTCTFIRSGLYYGDSYDKTYEDLLEDIRRG